MKPHRALLPLFALVPVFSALHAFAQSPSEAQPVIPPGKPERGLTLFVEKGCFQCHGAGATKLPEVELPPHLVIELGDEVHRPWTRDDFARAILNPNHTVAEDYRVAMMRIGDNFKAENSPMPEYADILTASELIHLTAFLESLSENFPLRTPAPGLP